MNKRSLCLLLLFPLALTSGFVGGCRDDASDPTGEEAPGATATVPAEALRLRNVGLAQLENEEPAEAETTFRRLTEVTPDDPLPWANLAIAELRLGRAEDALASVDRALALAPDRPDLLSIRAEALVGAGREDEALGAASRAMEGDDDDPEIVFQVYRLASVLGPEAEPTARKALARLSELRPENVLVLSALGRRALEDGDRTAATGAYLRIGELAWQSPETLEPALEPVMTALEENDLEAARIPAQRLENVLRVTPMYQQGQRELTLGIQGVPVWRFAGEAPAAPDAWGTPAEVTFETAAWEAGAAAEPAALAVGDFDDDGHDDLARLGPGGVEIFSGDLTAAVEGPPTLAAPAGLTTLLPMDLDNDGRLDLVASGPKDLVFWRGEAGDGARLVDATDAFGLQGAWGSGAAALDHDIEGDLDLALAGSGLALYRNALDGPLVNVGDRVFPDLEVGADARLRVGDLDRDGDLDLLVVAPKGLRRLDNLRQGRFGDASGGLGRITGRDAVLADLDNDGYLDLAVTGAEGLTILRNRLGDDGEAEPAFTDWETPPPANGAAHAVTAADFDHDGRLDLAVAGGAGVTVFVQRADGWQTLSGTGTQGGGEATALAVLDLDRDGDPDLVSDGPAGLRRHVNQGGNGNPWLTVRLRGLDRGNSKNNLLGRGSAVEVFAGDAYQFREADGPVVHFGLGAVEKPDMVRVTWTNGVPQDRLAPEPSQQVTEEQVLKGSCPFVYAWDGTSYRFVTDLLWNAPAGLPLAPGVWAPADPEELVYLGELGADDGPKANGDTLRLTVTEELWEAAFFDYQRLWVVDHPRGVRVASGLKVVPGSDPRDLTPEDQPDRLLTGRDPRPVARAWDGRDRDVTARVARRDDVYADGYEKSPYQGVAARPWTFTFDLGASPDDRRRLQADGARLFLTGWIFPADASLNLAVAQRSEPPFVPPRLEVEVDGRWRELVAATGHPAGKTKTMVVDTPPLPEGARRLRLVTSLWLHWDEIVWAPRPSREDPATRVVARLEPSAELRYRGFSEPVRRSPNGPHVFDYRRTTTRSPWLPFPGRYTRYGDVTELLASPDSRSVILGPGDEMRLAFDLSRLPPPAPGHVRTLFLESHGWDKDADRNTYAAAGVEPLPFRGMSGYPHGDDESFPDTPLHRRYRDEWLTRVVPASGATDAVPGAGR